MWCLDPRRQSPETVARRRDRHEVLPLERVERSTGRDLVVYNRRRLARSNGAGCWVGTAESDRIRRRGTRYPKGVLADGDTNAASLVVRAECGTTFWSRRCNLAKPAGGKLDGLSC